MVSNSYDIIHLFASVKSEMNITILNGLRVYFACGIAQWSWYINLVSLTSV